MGESLTLIVTHENTDFDALASLLGAAKLYPEATPVLPRRLNRNVRDFLTLCWDQLPFVRVEDLPKAPIARLIVVDSQTAPVLKSVDEKTPTLFIDHHPLTRELPPWATFSTSATGANTTIFVQQVMKTKTPISSVEATLFLLGIHEDTGSLTYAGTTPADARCAAWLMEKGANVEIVREFLHYPLSAAQRDLYNQLVAHSHTLEIYGHVVIIATASVVDYIEEISTLAHKLRDLLEPDALFLIVNLGDHIQMVARSTADAIDAGAIAAQFGGGGHSRAAAALVRDQTLDEVHARLVELLHLYVRPAITVGEIMSSGAPHTLSPETTIAEAAEMMRRYGHEGFPVVEDGRIVGILTRREIDKAMHHKLGGAALKIYMHKGEISVSPDDAVEHLQTVMMKHGLGQVPVVKEGKIVGIVTRTDLINLWSRSQARSRARDVSQAMEEALPPPLYTLLRKIGQVATERGDTLYLVGGFVRDLLLGTPTFDLDLVVEGDAIALTRALAQTYGGRVRSHSRFGTAKWLIGNTQWKAMGAETTNGDLPSSLDFVSARTEFYAQPTALPEVERSSIKQDLHRRDFTINTLAISLDSERFGELLDFYGGEQDLKGGLIRVLHSFSFIEDPTRMLRAARLEQRFGFRIEERTEELIANALRLLSRVGGERIQHELILILQEQEPERVLRRLQELDILRQIHPALYCDDWLIAKYRLARQGTAPCCVDQEEADEKIQARDTHHIPYILYFALLTFRMTPAEVEALNARLKMRSEDAQILREVAELATKAAKLKEPRPPSAIYRLLIPYSAQALSALWIATDHPLVRESIERFCREFRYVEPAIDGHYLKKRFALRPGPIYRRLLETLRDARLDGQVKTFDEEEKLAEHLLQTTTD
jgi:tRNA nucleotidyltransferase (CCA-adding enzyme)